MAGAFALFCRGMAAGHERRGGADSGRAGDRQDLLRPEGKGARAKRPAPRIWGKFGSLKGRLGFEGATPSASWGSLRPFRMVRKGRGSLVGASEESYSLRFAEGERSRAALGDGGDPPRVALLQEFVGVGSACGGRGRLAGGKSEPSERLHCSAGRWGAATAGATAGYPKAANRTVRLDLAAGPARSRSVRGGAFLWGGVLERF